MVLVGSQLFSIWSWSQICLHRKTYQLNQKDPRVVDTCPRIAYTMTTISPSWDAVTPLQHLGKDGEETKRSSRCTQYQETEAKRVVHRGENVLEWFTTTAMWKISIDRIVTSSKVRVNNSMKIKCIINNHTKWSERINHRPTITPAQSQDEKESQTKRRSLSNSSTQYFLLKWNSTWYECFVEWNINLRDSCFQLVTDLLRYSIRP